MTTRLFFGILSVAALLILAVFGESVLPLLILAAVVLIIMISLALSVYFSSSLEIGLTAESPGEKHQRLCGTVSVTNGCRFPFPLIHVVVETKNLLTGELFTSEVPFSVPPQKKVVSELRFASEHCGKLEISVKKIVVFDFFGMIGVRRNREALTSALILPELFPMDITVVKSGVMEPECDTFSPYKAGNDPSETFGIRDYEAGDPLRSVHWKLTGKFDRMVIRESSLPVNESVLLLFERTCSSERNFSSATVRNALGKIDGNEFCPQCRLASVRKRHFYRSSH